MDGTTAPFELDVADVGWQLHIARMEIANVIRWTTIRIAYRTPSDGTVSSCIGVIATMPTTDITAAPRTMNPTALGTHIRIVAGGFLKRKSMTLEVMRTMRLRARPNP